MGAHGCAIVLPGIDEPQSLGFGYGQGHGQERDKFWTRGKVWACLLQHCYNSVTTHFDRGVRVSASTSIRAQTVFNSLPLTLGGYDARSLRQQLLQKWDAVFPQRLASSGFGPFFLDILLLED